jgi:phage terminase large subunit-like protein
VGGGGEAGAAGAPHEGHHGLVGGRGFGKSFSLAGEVHKWVESGRYGRIAVVAPTSSDVRDTVVEGPAGIMAWAPRNRPHPRYQPSKRRITFWNGTRAYLFSAEEPQRFRGPQFHAAACDELAAWKRLQETWDMLRFCVRLGDEPRWAIATTPRSLQIIKDLAADPANHVVRGSTYDNAQNLAASFLEDIKRKYEGTRLGRQEIYAEILDDNPGALWRMAQIDALRVKQMPELKRIGIGVDPAVSHDETSNETGIIVGGVGDCYCEGNKETHGFLFDDLSGIYSPAAWAKKIIDAYDEHDVDRVIPEVNNGGDLVEANLRANGGQRLAIRPVRASKGKYTRAEPVAALYEQGKVHHVGSLAKLEDQMTQWNPMLDSGSPDRLDAAVHLLTDLMLGHGGGSVRSSDGPILPRRI